MLVAVVVVLLLAVVVFASTKPDAFHVERTATINAPPEKIFPLINDFHQWQSWSPYEMLDPSDDPLDRPVLKAGRGPSTPGTAAARPGQGGWRLSESAPSSNILIKLDFSRPFEAHNTATFTLAPAAQGHNGDVVDGRGEPVRSPKSWACSSTWIR